jgi:hypothetical protein
MARTSTKSDDQYSDQEAQRRTEAALRAAFNTPPKPQSEMKLGKKRGPAKASPRPMSQRSKRSAARAEAVTAISNLIVIVTRRFMVKPSGHAGATHKGCD